MSNEEIANSVFAVTLWNITAANDSNPLYNQNMARRILANDEIISAQSIICFAKLL